MARFQFSLCPFLAPRADAVLARRALDELRLGDAADPPQGPGWFDSSWELSHGLEVDESLPGDDRYDAWIAARAARKAAAAPRPGRSDPLDIADLGRRAPAPRAHAAPQDDFSRFGIEGLELA